MRYSYRRFRTYQALVDYLNSEAFQDTNWNLDRWQDTGGVYNTDIRAIFKMSVHHIEGALPQKPLPEVK